MMTRRDRLWIAGKKLTLRKRWMFFTLFSLSLGLTVFTATTSLAEGVRAAFVNTIELVARRVPEDHLKVTVRDPRKPRTPGVKDAVLDSAAVTRLTTLPGVDAVSPALEVTPVQLSLPLETAEPMFTVRGMEEAFLERLMPRGSRLADLHGRVPIVIGRYLLQSRYDEQAQGFRMRRGVSDASFIGRDLDLTVGANVPEMPFREDYKDGKRRIVRTTREERATRVAEQYRYLRNRYDMNIYQRALRLKARIVAIGTSDQCLIPLPVARDLKAWLQARETLSNHAPEEREDETERFPFVWLLARDAAHVPAVAAAVKEAGFHATHRSSIMQEQLDEFGAAMKVVRMIFYAVGGVIFLISCLFVWTTMSRVISDSRREIGVFRAVGATRRDVLSIFLLQAALLGAAGAILGVMSGFGAAAGISKLVLHLVRQQDLQWSVEEYGFDADDVLPAVLHSVDPVAVGLMVLGAVIASIVAGLVPAWRAANMDPVAALQRRD